MIHTTSFEISKFYVMSSDALLDGRNADNLRPLSHQVAGHMFNSTKNNNAVGFFEVDDGTILKGLQDHKRGQKELTFYQKVFAEENAEKYVWLKTFLAKYYGTVKLNGMSETKFLKLEDITKKYRKPCIFDIKICGVKWNPDTKEKMVEKRKAKFPLVHELGFILGGMRVYDKTTDTFTFVNKYDIRTLPLADILTKGLGLFVRLGQQDFHCCVVSALLCQLYSVREWFQSQREFLIFSSSLLLVYEGDLLKPPDQCPDCERLHSLHNKIEPKHNGFINLLKSKQWAYIPNGECKEINDSDRNLDGLIVKEKKANITQCCDSQNASKSNPCHELNRVSSSEKEALCDVDIGQKFKRVSQNGRENRKRAPEEDSKESDKSEEPSPRKRLKVSGESHDSPSTSHKTKKGSQNEGKNSCDEVGQTRPVDKRIVVEMRRNIADVRMIDFTHVFEAESQLDDNYLYGLNKLIAYFKRLLVKGILETTDTNNQL